MKNFTLLLLSLLWVLSLSAQRSEKSQYNQHKYNTEDIMQKIPEGNLSNIYKEDSPDLNSLKKQKKYLKNTEAVKQRLDSIVYRTYDTLSGTWKIAYKAEYEYNENGQLTSYKDYHKDTATNNWELGYQEIITYNEKGNMATYTELINSDGEMVNHYKEVYTYDEYGWPIIYTEYVWSKSKMVWVEDYKEEYSYDKYGRDSVYVEYVYDTVSMEWKPDYKEEYSYSENGRLLTYIGYHWNSAETKWDNSSKGTYSYDENGFLHVFTGLTWDADWQNSSKETYTHNETGDILSKTLAKWIVSEWVNDSKEENSYNDYGLTLLNSYLYWNGSDWENGSKTEYTYNEDQLASVTSSYWDIISLTWVFYYQQLHTLNPAYRFNSMILPYWFAMVYYRYMVLNIVYLNWIVNGWVQFQDAHHYYSETGEITSDIINHSVLNTKVYPNPSNDSFVFSWKDNYTLLDLEIYDIHGKLVLQKRITNNSKVNITDLSNGLYFYKLISQDNRVRMGKISVR